MLGKTKRIIIERMRFALLKFSNHMSLQHLKLKEIKESDLLRLVTDGIGETKTIEYKEALVYATDEQKRELLSDITALANTDGGDLLLGVKAEKGMAKELVGLRNLQADDAMGKIENLLRDFVQPRIIGCEVMPIALECGNTVLIIRVPRSFAAPHMIRHQGVTRFCGRNSNGKYDLDVHELRSAFLANETLSERLKGFRLERVNKLQNSNMPVKMTGEHLLVLHLLPIVGTRSNFRLSNTDFQRATDRSLPGTMTGGGGGSSYNFDGLIVTSMRSDNLCNSYTQVLRNGFLEAVESRTLEPTPLGREGGELHKIIPSLVFEQRYMNVLSSAFKAFSELQLPPPYVLSLSLLNVKEYLMFAGWGYEYGNTRPVDREHLLTEEVLIESLSENAGKILRPLFDQIWNACGWQQSINYDEHGNRKERR